MATSVTVDVTANFNPRSRKGSDRGKKDLFHKNRISIHAPARGATILIQEGGNLLIFQSTLPQGERPGSIGTTQYYTDFNPRSRKGSDPAISVIYSRIYISIHAPARGATSANGTVHGCKIDFNPRSRKGSDSKIQSFCHLFCISIHAPARGATRLDLCDHTVYRYFNPRSRKGSDSVRALQVRTFLYFNPRSRKGSDGLPCKAPCEFI